ncbi:hypothetical protein HY385_00780 [Candidatus Daviesbacteria bacterium]|nr:hypothetical protein [Candidatus Daviesbacteria bacterium]
MAEYQEIRAQIIGSVLNDGLVAGNFLRERNSPFLGSADMVDEEVNDVVNFLRLRPNAPYREIIYGLYPSENSLFRVVCERPNNCAESLLVASRRAEASFLVVCEENTVLRDVEYYYENSCTWTEGVGVPNIVTPDKFHLLIFPQKLWKAYSGIVDPHRISISVTDNKILRYIYDRDRIAALVPDYEAVLLQLVKEATSSLLIHVVRLPTIHDIGFSNNSPNN